MFEFTSRIDLAHQFYGAQRQAVGRIHQGVYQHLGSTLHRVTGGPLGLLQSLATVHRQHYFGQALIVIENVMGRQWVRNDVIPAMTSPGGGCMSRASARVSSSVQKILRIHRIAALWPACASICVSANTPPLVSGHVPPHSVSIPTPEPRLLGSGCLHMQGRAALRPPALDKDEER